MKEISVDTRSRKVNFWVKICLSTVAVLLLIIGIKINMDINEMKVQVEKAQAEHQQRLNAIEEIKAEIKKLPENPEDLDEATIRKIARDELGLCDSDIVIYANSQPN